MDRRIARYRRPHTHFRSSASPFSYRSIGSAAWPRRPHYPHSPEMVPRYWHSFTAGMCFDSAHPSTDIAVAQGQLSSSATHGAFRAHTRRGPVVNAPARVRCGNRLRASQFPTWACGSYMGILNTDTITERARVPSSFLVSPQWPDLHGKSSLASFVALYHVGEWMDRAPGSASPDYIIFLLDEEYSTMIPST